jgi:hypothetical protein
LPPFASGQPCDLRRRPADVVADEDAPAHRRSVIPDSGALSRTQRMAVVTVLAVMVGGMALAIGAIWKVGLPYPGLITALLLLVVGAVVWLGWRTSLGTTSPTEALPLGRWSRAALWCALGLTVAGLAVDNDWARIAGAFVFVTVVVVAAARRDRAPSSEGAQ